MTIYIKEQSAVILSQDIGLNTKIGHFCIINENVKIGINCIIHPYVVIHSGVIIGDNVEIFSGTVIGREPKSVGSISRKLDYDPFVKIGDNVLIGCNAVIYYDVLIGNDCLIGDGASIREKAIIGNNCVISRHVSFNYNVKVGNSTKIMDLTHITGNTIIGDNVFISAHVGTANDNLLGKKGYSDHVVGPIIEDGVSIGIGALILPNVRIKKGSIVGAGAVVTKDVEALTKVIGIPAKSVNG